MDIDYQKLLDESGLELVRKILLIIQKQGLDGDNHFYISFKTDDPFVVLSPRMKARYPEEITVVLQHQFENLVIGQNEFSVKISFDGLKEIIQIPFMSITAFVDPSTKFSLQFRREIEDSLEPEKITVEEAPDPISFQQTNADNVIQLDRFRNKNK